MTINSNKKRSLLLIGLCGICLILSGLLHISFKKPQLIVEKQSSAININQSFLNFFSIGQKRLIADLLWITTLLESDHAHYKKNDLNSWLYLRFNSIINLDPMFVRVYHFGGVYLNMIKNDLYGSEQIFQKGHKLFPNNYHILYNYGFLLAYELKKFSKAIEVYEQLLAHSKAPPFIKSLIAKLKYEDSGDLDLAFELLSQMYKTEPDGSPLKQKFKTELYAIKAQKDLECLNARKKSCERIDFFGAHYLFINGEYQAAEKFNRFKLHLRGEKKGPKK